MTSPHIVHVSSLPTTRCGVAEYTASLSSAMEAAEPRTTPFFVRLDYESAEPRVSGKCISIDPSNDRAVEMAAETVNQLLPQSILLQHEFKLYGGSDGENVLRFLERVKAPVVATLHTVSPSLPENRQRILREILMRSAKLVVFSERARLILMEMYAADAEKVKVIPHGVPDVAFMRPGALELPEAPRRGVSFITCGLLRPAKGIEDALAAFALLKNVFTDFTYVICGADHPRNPAAGEYRRHLLELVEYHELKDHVVFLDRFLEPTAMIRAIQACDAGIFAYKSPEQSSSGVLALTLSCGRPVIATDFQYARAVVNGDNGILVPAGNSGMLTEAIESLALDSGRRIAMGTASHQLTRGWAWRDVARKHFQLIDEKIPTQYARLRKRASETTVTG
jgi:glycosyltransferase involved in cell wall biosynthesis